MARGRQSHGNGGGALLACDRAIERRGDYESNVKKLHVRAKMLAETLREDSQLANILKESDDPNAEAWLQAQRDKVKALAEGNAKRMYDIEYFVDAVKEVRAEVATRQANAGGAGAEGEGEGGPDAEPEAPDYERAVHEAVDRVRQRGEANPARVPPAEHELTLIVREELGEKVPKKSRASRGGDDDDDDLEIVRNAQDDVHALKCPITGMLFADPVRNRVCGHTYDRAGLHQQLRNRKHTCPVPGCTNSSVTMAQVEEDEEMKLKVKRHKTREEAEKRKRDLEDDADVIE
ncbi:hypothetical protein ACHAXT_002568 [Thalassiosira profunda]